MAPFNFRRTFRKTEWLKVSVLGVLLQEAPMALSSPKACLIASFLYNSTHLQRPMIANSEESQANSSSCAKSSTHRSSGLSALPLLATLCLSAFSSLKDLLDCPKKASIRSISYSAILSSVVSKCDLCLYSNFLAIFDFRQPENGNHSSYTTTSISYFSASASITTSPFVQMATTGYFSVQTSP